MFRLCLISLVILMMFTDRVSIFGVHGLPISIIQKRVNRIYSVIKITIFFLNTKIWVVICSQCPFICSNDMHILPLPLNYVTNPLAYCRG